MLRVAVSRHHQVVVVVPWPTGMTPPSEEPEEDDQRHDKTRQLYGVGVRTIRRHTLKREA